MGEQGGFALFRQPASVFTSILRLKKQAADYQRPA
jgi:hypothetical protein